MERTGGKEVKIYETATFEVEKYGRRIAFLPEEIIKVIEAKNIAVLQDLVLFEIYEKPYYTHDTAKRFIKMSFESPKSMDNIDEYTGTNIKFLWKVNVKIRNAHRRGVSERLERFMLPGKKTCVPRAPGCDSSSRAFVKYPKILTRKYKFDEVIIF